MSTLLVAGVLSLVIQLPMLALLRRAQVLDRPCERSSHVVPTVRGGGIAVVLAVVGAAAIVLLDGPPALGTALPAVVALGGMALLGVVEDIHGVPSAWRLGLQLLIAMTAGMAAVAYGAPAWVALVMCAAVVVYANAFNFMDGLNGISGLNAGFAGLVYATIALRYDAPGVATVALAVSGAALGFLPHNFPSARMFLGDSGSYALGGVIAVLAVQCLAAGAPPLLCVAPVSVYLADTGWTLLARARRGEPLMVAHREHAYQRLADSAVGHVDAACTTVLVAAAVTGIVYAAGDVGAGPLLGLCLSAGILLAYLVVPGAVPITTRPGVSAAVGIKSIRGATQTRVG